MRLKEVKKLREEREKKAMQAVAAARRILAQAQTARRSSEEKLEETRQLRLDTEKQLYEGMIGQHMKPVEIEMLKLRVESVRKLEGIARADLQQAIDIEAEKQMRVEEQRKAFVERFRAAEKWRHLEKKEIKRQLAMLEQKAELDQEEVASLMASLKVA